MALPLEVLADLQLSIDGEQIDIRGNGKTIVVDLPSLEAGQKLVTTGPLAIGDRQRSMERVNEALSIAGLTVDVRLRGDTLARVGAGARPGGLSRLLRLGSIEIRSSRTLLAVARERPLATVGVVLGLVLLVALLLRRSGDDE